MTYPEGYRHDRGKAKACARIYITTARQMRQRGLEHRRVARQLAFAEQWLREAIEFR
jgi:hypothetical protein